MNCKTCDYPLWNLRARECPECGAPYLPSQYRFVANSVRFCCKHCGQDYYGTSPAGHLVPTAFDCVRCGRHVHMDEMVLLPTEGVSELQTRQDEMPWLERGRIGRVRAWLATVYQGMFMPARLITATPVEAPAGAALWYAAVTLAIAIAPTALVLLSLFGIAGPAPMAAMMMLLGPFMIYAVGGLLVWPAAAHGLLRLTGPTEGPLGRTVHAIGFGAGVNILIAVPCLGFYLGAVSLAWWAASAGVMLAYGQGVAWWRALLAALVLPAICIVFYGSLVVYVMTGAMGAAAAAPGPAVQFAQPGVQLLLDATRGHAASTGAWPGHALELIVDGGRGASDFVLAGGGSSAAAVAVEGTALDMFGLLPRGAQEEVAGVAAAKLPEDVVAHRLGDYVFTYHGLDPAGGEPGLWLVVVWPDPAQARWVGPVPAAGGSVWVGRADGTVQAIDGQAFDAALRAQNRLRSGRGLASLPHPSEVTHDRPARAGDGDSSSQGN